MTTYPTLSLGAAQKVMKALEAQSKQFQISDHVVIKGDGETLDNVLDTLSKAIDRESGVLKKSSRDSKLDSKLASIVHRYLSVCDPEVLQDRDFWRYLSCYKFHKLVAIRFPPKKKKEVILGKKEQLDSNWENFGAKVEDVKNSYLYRLYIAASLTYDFKSKDPYNLLLAVTDVDIYRSHIIRVKSGDNPDYSKALISWYANSENWYKKYEQKLKISSLFDKYDDGPRRKHLRDIAKRTLRLRSNIVHEFLNRAELEKMISDEAEKSLKAIAKWGKSKDKVRNRSNGKSKGKRRFNQK